MGAGMMKATGAAIATSLTREQTQFLRELATWAGVASARDLGPQTSQKQNSARQRCKRQQLVTYEGGYWRMSNMGWVVHNVISGNQ